MWSNSILNKIFIEIFPTAFINPHQTALHSCEMQHKATKNTAFGALNWKCFNRLGNKNLIWSKRLYGEKVVRNSTSLFQVCSSKWLTGYILVINNIIILSIFICSFLPQTFEIDFIITFFEKKKLDYLPKQSKDLNC